MLIVGSIRCILRRFLRCWYLRFFLILFHFLFRCFVVCGVLVFLLWGVVDSIGGFQSIVCGRARSKLSTGCFGLDLAQILTSKLADCEINQISQKIYQAMDMVKETRTDAKFNH